MLHKSNKKLTQGEDVTEAITDLIEEMRTNEK
jgi:hypothetical protein